MGTMSAKTIIEEMLQSVGIKINGSEQWDIQIYNEQFYNRTLNEGVVAIGESYMDKWWDCSRLDMFIYKVLRANYYQKINIPLHFKIKTLLARFVNFQTLIKSKEVAQKHYNLGNDLFHAMLDPRMMYSCGYWKEAKDLASAQTAKLDLICRKLQLKPGSRLLDIGCGWGGLAKFAAENYGVNVVGVTISEEQCNYAKEYCKGLPIEIRLQDYREIKEKFDNIVSVGMFEHVGHLNYRNFMQIARESLADDGLFLLHTIGGNETSLHANEWISKYIFPNGNVPSIKLISKASEKLFIMEDWHNFGADYDKTLMCWYENFVNSWKQLKTKYDDKFFRMWSFYLLGSAGSFRARTNQLWQIVFSKNGMAGGYKAVR